MRNVTQRTVAVIVRFIAGPLSLLTTEVDLGYVPSCPFVSIVLKEFRFFSVS